LLVGIQVVVSSVLLVVCANLIMAAAAEANRPIGLNSERVMLTTHSSSVDDRHPLVAARLDYWDRLTNGITARIPGATVAFASAPPTSPAIMPAQVDGTETTADRGASRLPMAVVSPEYFDALGISIRAGRGFEATEDASSLPVAIVDERSARKHWPGQDAIGKRIRVDSLEGSTTLTVIGVASAVTGSPYSSHIGVIYRPLRQAAPDAYHLIVKLPATVTDAETNLRAAAFAADRGIPLRNLQSLDDYLRAANLDLSSIVPVFSVIGTITLLLAATGLYGLVSRSVARRTQEIGIRVALGASHGRIAAIFLKQGVAYLSIGIVGCLVGVVLTRFLTDVFPNVMAQIVTTTSLVVAIVGAVIFVSSYLPTRRALALEPGDALRCD
jgi:ABC-type antimicrobial peptide transport system permease subunit